MNSANNIPSCGLGDLARYLQARVQGDPSSVVTGIAADSRKVSPGDLFCAVPGERFDGRHYATDAVQRGAAAVMTPTAIDGLTVPCLIVDDVRKAMGPAASRIFGFPSRQMRVAGVTGTNGKTSTVTIAAHILRTAGRKVCVAGTLGVQIDGQAPLDYGHTTPEAPDLQRALFDALQTGVTDVVMEVASHGISMERTRGVEFDVVAFTNLTQDHLDYYGDMQTYAAAKWRLFSEYPLWTRKPTRAVINIDDDVGRSWSGMIDLPVWTTGERTGASFHASDVECALDGLHFTLTHGGASWRVTMPLGGRFQVSNALTAVAMCAGLGVDPGKAVAALPLMPPVPGRFEVVDSRGPAVVVDYAHTPDGLVNLLETARQLPAGRVILVFGCGGDRDRTKRPIMGEIASRMADVIVVTSDNPRTESPAAIIDAIIDGIPADARNRLYREEDRRQAIGLALSLAHPDDLIIIAGKGHETYQIIGTERHHFDDREIAKEWITGRATWNR